MKDLSTWPGHMQANMVVTMPVDATSYILRVETSRSILKFVVRSLFHHHLILTTVLVILQLWDADVQPSSGQVFTVTNKHWFQGKKQGEVMELGFQMEFGAGEVPNIVVVSLEM